MRPAGVVGDVDRATTVEAAASTLFDPEFLARLDMLALRIGTVGKGGRLGGQRTAARGQGDDFADYRAYVPGDYLRSVDWTLYRRLGRVFVREFEERQAAPVYILTDLSPSMFVERPPRIDAARRVALAIAALALAQGEAVRLFAFSDTLDAGTPAMSGKFRVARVAEVLAGYRPGGGTALAEAIGRIGAMGLRRGLLVVVSDLFDPAGPDTLAAALGQVPHALLLVQMVRATDADPALAGEVALTDGEVDDPVALAATPAVLDRYRAAYRAFAQRIDQIAAARRATLLRIDADGDVVDQLATVLADGRRLL